MAPLALNTSSSAAQPSSQTATQSALLPNPFSIQNRPQRSSASQDNPFSTLNKHALDAQGWVKNTNQNRHVFKKQEFEAHCEAQRDYEGKVNEGRGLGGLTSPSQIVEMLWKPVHKQNIELADEVNEWVEFLPYGDAIGRNRLAEGSNDNSALKLCKWILTTRSQDDDGQWSYVDRHATMEEVLSFKEKGWPWYR